MIHEYTHQNPQQILATESSNMTKRDLSQECKVDLTSVNTNLDQWIRTESPGNSLAVQWLGLSTFTVVVAQVQSLVRELRTHKPRGTTKKKKKATTTKKLRVQKHTFIWIVNLFSTKVPTTQFSGSNMVFFQQMVLGQLDSHMQKDKFRLLPQIMHKNDVKMDYRALGEIILKVWNFKEKT